MKTRPIKRKTRSVVQLLHHAQTEETDYKNVVFQPDHISSKHEVPLSYMVAVVTVFWPFMQTFLKCSPLIWDFFLRHFPTDLYLKYSCPKNICCSTVYLRWGMLSHHWRTEKCIYQQQTQWSIAQVFYHQQLKLHSPFENNTRELTWPHD